MSFDRTTRNALAHVVAQARERLKFDVMDQLLRLGFQADGYMLDLDQIAGLSERERMAGRELRDLLEHFVVLESGSGTVRRQAAYDRLAREIGFTTLNRLVALHMAEERGLIVQSVGRGLASDGFQIYERITRDALGNRAETYRAYLECLYDELVIDLPVLFDRTTPESRIFPSERCLQDVLGLLNDASLAHLWMEDEAIGWVYQYYNDPDERKKMREVQAPRNSRELAVRNQFFTPRYVVEFLTDNTLGRLWYEMRQGKTQLRDQCCYLVRHPVEIYLQDGEEAPQSAEPEEDLSSEELLNWPVFIPFRVKKDPRDLKILDPACGSGHFLLYAFDLLKTIYEEAWADSDSPISLVIGTRLRNDYADIDTLRRDLPGLILRYNLYGIDIDLRACQIAGLALWLRSQRSYQAQGLRPTDRPSITKSNIVCAEPMPGEREFLDEYLKRHVDQRLHDLVRIIWEKMQLVGEAGILLKIEQEIEVELGKARERAMIDIPNVQVSLFQQDNSVIQERMTFSTLEEHAFWNEAEQKLLTALSDYAMQAPNGHVIQRRLFAEDAVQGFAFVDLCRNRFDVVLMNPPFGATSSGFKKFLEARGESKDLAAAFISNTLEIVVQDGFVGSITTRTIYFIKGLSDWRRELVKDVQGVNLFLDLGYGVLDAAVETCATVIQKSSRPRLGTFIHALGKNEEIDQMGSRFLQQVPSYFTACSKFESIPNFPFAYWASSELILSFTKYPTVGDRFQIRSGGNPRDDFRFVRHWVEVDSSNKNDEFVLYSKGGEFRLYHYDVHLVIQWKDSGRELKVHAANYRKNLGWSADWRALMNNYDDYFKPGITWPRRTSRLGFRFLPAGCVFGDKSPVILVKDGDKNPCSLSSYLAVLNTKSFATALNLMVGGSELAQSFEVGIVRNCPLPEFPSSNIENQVYECFTAMQALDSFDETSHEYVGFTGGLPLQESLTSTWNKILEYRVLKAQTVLKLQAHFETLIAPQFGESAIDSQLSAEDFNLGNLKMFVKDLVSYLIGCVFGRWDLRFLLNPTLLAVRTDPLAKLPPCSPAMLQSSDERLASSSNIASEEWFISKSGSTTFPTQDSIQCSTITNFEYPLSIAWDGILVDDSVHPTNITYHIREVMAVLWPSINGAMSEKVEREVCQILGVNDLRKYLFRPSAFFEDHLKRYSKSHRQAPIYWPLSTSSGSYTLWIYYHRLTSDTLFTAINHYVDPKVAETQRKINELEAQLMDVKGRDTTRQREERENIRTFLVELQSFRNELLRVAALPYHPNLNDGVIINAAPLYRLFSLPKWAKDTKECWEKLQRGEYDWAHLAYTIWPDRVREKCRVDHSVAIAHNLENLYIEQQTTVRGKGSQGKDKEDEE